MSVTDTQVDPEEFPHSEKSALDPNVSSPGNCDTPVVVQWTSQGETVSTPGMLQDLSSGGIRLLLETPIPLKKTIRLRIRAIDLDFDCTLSAEVCWIRSRGPNQWLLGCSFATEFPESALATLAQEGFLNRRKDPRNPISLTAFARQELNEDAINVRLEDYSCGGFRMYSPTCLTVGERVLVLVSGRNNESLAIASRVLWQLKADGGYFIGCCFLNHDSYGHLVQVIREQDPRKSGDAPKVEMDQPGWGKRISSMFGGAK